MMYFAFSWCAYRKWDWRLNSRRNGPGEAGIKRERERGAEKDSL